MSLTRDSLSNNSFMQRMLDEAPGAMSLMDPEAFEASRQAILAEAEKTGELWVFGYGSLIWNPIIEIAERRPARLNGYARRFCVWALIGRGSPENPGLWLGLDEGGLCDGVALRIAPELWDAETTILWRREMISAVYRPAWLPLEIDGRSVPACVFLANPEHDRYADVVSWRETTHAIAKAEGSMGTCREYLFSLADHLAEAGLSDDYIERLATDVRAAE